MPPDRISANQFGMMTIEIETNRQSLYETDYLRWLETTVEKLQIQDYSNIDWENLIEKSDN